MSSYYYDTDDTNDNSNSIDDNTTTSSDSVILRDSFDNSDNASINSSDEDRNQYNAGNNNSHNRPMFYNALRISNHLFEEIYEKEEDFIDSEKENGQYFIGMTATIHDYIPGIEPFGSIITSYVTPKTFFSYTFNTMRSYLILLSYTFPSSNNVDIIKLHYVPTEHGTMYVALAKTYWLRLIQRHWKKIYAQRCAIIDKRASISVFLYFQIKGKYKNGLNSLPNIRGMLSHYA